MYSPYTKRVKAKKELEEKPEVEDNRLFGKLHIMMRMVFLAGMVPVLYLMGAAHWLRLAGLFIWFNGMLAFICHI